MASKKAVGFGLGTGLAACALALLLLVQLASAVQQRLEILSQECVPGNTTPSGEVEQADTSSLAEDEIPEEMLEIYVDVAEQWEMDWAILAAIGKRESTHNTDPTSQTENGSRALGPMQFIPAAWEHHGRHYGDSTGSQGTPPLEDRLDPETAVWSAANKLTDQGVNSDPEAALFKYNNAQWYVDEVMEIADSYRDGDFVSAEGGDIILASDDCKEEGTGTPGTAPNYETGALSAQTSVGPCIVDDPPFSPSSIRPITCAAHKNFVENFRSQLTNGGNCGRSGSWGDHPRGLACDYMTSPLGTVATGDQELLGDRIAEHALNFHEVLGVKYVIWRQSIWNAGWTECPAHRADRNEPWHNNVPDFPGGKWCSMNNTNSVTNDHYDHVHISYIG